MDRPPVGQVEDLATLAQLDEDILLNELKTRYGNDDIYTYIGDILVAVNPYRQLGIYDKAHSDQYNGTSRSSQPPHIFAVADAAYQRMRGVTSIPRDQCVLISGESGAGKTESTKLIIRQLIELCKGNTYIEQQILQCNPILEAFGNAQTSMNDNSSRFGRYIQLRFKNGQVMGTKINEYLLEKSRLVTQGRGEQNFHIFYYMFAGLPEEIQQTYCLDDPSKYSYLSDGLGVLKTDKEGLVQKYEELINALDIVGFSDTEQNDMFTVLSGALNIGNIEIHSNDKDEAVLANPGSANTVAKLIGLDAAELRGLLTSSVTFVKGQEIKRNYTVAQGLDSRDAIAKAVYGRLFGWIINKVNQLLAPTEMLTKEQTQEIDILDIFGFEKFDNNGFEQACINLANEQLQFFFNKHIFLLEQEEYQREGVDWREIKFVDNKDILDLFLGRPIGILSLLDEESQFPNGTDLSFVEKVTNKFDDHPNYVKSPHSGVGVFTIKHYAGDIKYTIDGWLEKNRDTVPPGVMEMLQQSKNELLGLIFRGRVTRTGTLALQGVGARETKRVARNAATSAKERKMTVSTQFKNSLQVLMERMTSAEPIFIRCIKPNNQKSAGVFIDDFVQAQLLYTGMLETTKIRREGFAVRPSFEEFVNKFKVIARRLSMPANSDSCRAILTASKLSGWHIGKTKVFLKYWHLEKLGELLEELGKLVIRIQKVVRGYLARRRVYHLRKEIARQKAEEERRLRESRSLPPVPQVVPSAPVPAELPTYATQLPQNPHDDGDNFDMVKVNKPSKPDSRKMSLRWFQETQLPQLQEAPGQFAEWFHGIITRKEAERLLKHQSMGCFLIRVSESRFGYSLSFKAEDRCRHYMIDQTPSGKYVIVGEPRVHRSLNELIQYYRRTALSNWAHTLGSPCGQEEGQCDYWDLLNEENRQLLQRPKYSAPTPNDPDGSGDTYLTALDPPLKKSVLDAFDDGKVGLRGANSRRIARLETLMAPAPGPPPPGAHPPGVDLPPPLPRRNKPHPKDSPVAGRPLPNPLQNQDKSRNQDSLLNKAALDRRVKLSTTRQRTLKAPHGPSN